MVCLFLFAVIRDCLDGVGYQVVPSFSLSKYTLHCTERVRVW